MGITGILLAGGQSRRYGSPKAFAELEGKYYYEHVRDALSAVCREVVIVTRPELTDRFPARLRIITDAADVAGAGPLAGIHSAMRAAGDDRYFVLPCDMPYVTGGAVRNLAAFASPEADVSAVRTEEEPLPLFSIWSGRVEVRLGEALRQNRLSVMGFLGQSHTEWIGSGKIHPDSTIFCNINTPDDQRKGGRQT
ncbi:molybdenum cofactor guanylyltransferase [Indiicoccus explosivorum]|uniref:molybdenum cofactor guanylyltransferase n=1 Tax=Indiicoccus explosivorum TaxID=1917864 RepID=UPI000B447791|nr:molybdenum cofactor guanylyltransferase [Indiicoccus explosivorum]